MLEILMPTINVVIFNNNFNNVELEHIKLQHIKNISKQV